ncbi:MAG: hypothetical protein ABSF51_10875 [Verrucomicrobiota bacterium]|jgi:hypothetical protein
MFDLEQSITDWRQQMLAAGIKTPVPLEELECHLREEIEQLMKSELNARRAFDKATQEVGKANMLKNEFEKIGGTKEARNLKPYRTIMVACLGVESLFWAMCILSKLGHFSEITTAQQMSGLAAIAVMVLLASIGLPGQGPVSVILSRRMRDVICHSNNRLMGLMSLCFFALVTEPLVFFFTLPTFGVGGLWVMLPLTGFLYGFIGGLEKAGLKRSSVAGV